MVQLVREKDNPYDRWCAAPAPPPCCCPLPPAPCPLPPAPCPLPPAPCPLPPAPRPPPPAPCWPGGQQARRPMCWRPPGAAAEPAAHSKSGLQQAGCSTAARCLLWEVPAPNRPHFRPPTPPCPFPRLTRLTRPPPEKKGDPGGQHQGREGRAPQGGEGAARGWRRAQKLRRRPAAAARPAAPAASAPGSGRGTGAGCAPALSRQRLALPRGPRRLPFALGACARTPLRPTAAAAQLSPLFDAGLVRFEGVVPNATTNQFNMPIDIYCFGRPEHAQEVRGGGGARVGGHALRSWERQLLCQGGTPAAAPRAGQR
jgi:hypothetical protein